MCLCPGFKQKITRFTADEAISFLADRWCDDGYCADKKYYIRKLNQLRRIIERNLTDAKK